MGRLHAGHLGRDSYLPQLHSIVVTKVESFIFKKMPRECKQTPEEIGQAVRVVLDGNISARAAAADLGFPQSALQRHVQAAKKVGPENVAIYTFRANPSARQVFTKEQEEILAAYLLKASKIHYGLTTINTRKLAYQYAVRLQLNCSQQWNTTEMTGRDWLLGFRDRHPTLSLRCPEATILGRASGFHKFTMRQQPQLAVNEKNSIFEETSTVEEYNLDEKANRCSTPPCSLNLSMISPEDVVPFPKAAPRRMTAGNRIKERTRILTDSNEIKEIEHVENE
ncbi:hypothetical protein ILUMI_14728 [Ignelater luminosus]|uniref:HTH CENPB-type domain-containing protein n=1 Tax=Ignelater luminosus TaxID=2038154 RepID=A0A8K0CY17_IGNLU|nr:hypothetical protein ILUMI_14728 [Ignelater luminosus]